MYHKKLMLADQKLPELIHHQIQGNFIHQLRHTERIVEHLFTNWDKIDSIDKEFAQTQEDVKNYVMRVQLLREHKSLHQKAIRELKDKRKNSQILQKQLRASSNLMSTDVRDVVELAQIQAERLKKEIELLKRRINLLREYVIKNGYIKDKKQAKRFERRYKQVLKITKPLLKF